MEAEKPQAKPKPKPRTSSSSGAGVNDLDKNSSKTVMPQAQPQSKNSIPDGNNLVDALLKHNKVLDDSLDKFEEKTAKSEETVLDLEKGLAEMKANSAKFDEQIALLQSQHSSTDDETTAEIQKYLTIYERLKSDEKLFKYSCNEELERLQQELMAHDTDASDTNKAEIQAQLDKYREKIEAGRVELASINRKVATLKRQIEQVPNRMELREYRLRFSELYNQVSATHRSTKQFFSLYNSLEDTKRYLEKELSLLNSIVDSYQLASGTASGREDFLQQLQTIHDGMRETCSKVEKRLQADRIGVEKVQLESQKLVDMKVSYEKCLRELEAECKRNDQLMSECKALEKASLSQ